MRALIILTALAVNSPAIVVDAQEPAPAPLPTVDLPSELERVLRDYEQAWAAGDSRGLADLFTVDGFVLRPGRPPARGRTAIQSAYRNVGGDLALRALDYAVSDSVGYIIGGFSGELGGQDIGKFVLAVRRGPSGLWLIVADIDNEN